MIAILRGPYAFEKAFDEVSEGSFFSGDQSSVNL